MYFGTGSNVYIQMGKTHSASWHGQHVGIGSPLQAVCRLLMLFSWCNSPTVLLSGTVLVRVAGEKKAAEIRSKYLLQA